MSLCDNIAICTCNLRLCYLGAIPLLLLTFFPGIYRAAMLGYVILAYVEYNQELRKAAALVYSQLQQQGTGGIGL